MNPKGKLGCLAIVIFLAVLAGIYFYAGRETIEDGPSPSEGYLPPPQP